MASKHFAIVGLGLLVAAVAVYLIAFHESGTETDKGPKGPTTTTTPKPKTEPPIATAEVPKPQNTRTEVGEAVAAINGGVEGVVTDVRGQPVAGARVELVRTLQGGAFALQFQNTMNTKQKTEAKVYSCSSGADGRYRLAAPPAESWKLTATHPDFRREEHLNLATPADSYLSFPIQMKAGVRLFGRVTEDQKNMPVVGAIVILDDAPTTPNFAASSEERRETTTDSSGSFKFENLRPGRHSVSVKAQTYGTKDNPVLNVPDEPHYRFDVRLAPGRNISGRVVDANNHGVPNARVTATTAGLGTSHGVGMTNELGEYVVLDLDDGRYFLTADAGDAGQGRSDSATPIPAGATDVEIKLVARSGARGMVKDKGTGQPITKFSLEVRRSNAKGSLGAPRELGPLPFGDRKDGSFEIFGVDPNGEHVVYVTAEGYAPNYSERFTVQPGQVTPGVDVVLSQGGRISGKVVDARNNQPVAGASIRTRDNEWTDISAVPLFGALLGNQPQRTADVTVTSDSEGRFELRNIPEGTIQLQVTHPSFVSIQQRDVTVTEGAKNEIPAIRLSVGSSVKGTVFGSDGAPAAIADVTIQLKMSPGLTGGPRPFVTRNVRCDAQGKYSIRTLPAGDYTIYAIPSGTENGFLRMGLAQKSKKEVTLLENAEQEVDLFISN